MRAASEKPERNLIITLSYGRTEGRTINYVCLYSSRNLSKTGEKQNLSVLSHIEVGLRVFLTENITAGGEEVCRPSWLLLSTFFITHIPNGLSPLDARPSRVPSPK